MTSKYDRIGTQYNHSRKADAQLTQNLVRLLAPNQKGLYLDVGCGTGNYTIALQDMGFSMIGLDPSERMLEQARQKSQIVSWKIGSAEETGLPSEYVDGVIATLTIHHWSDMERSFSELFRVLKPGGRIVLFTSSPDQMKHYWLHHYFPEMMEESMRQMPDPGIVMKIMSSCGFTDLKTEPYAVKRDLEDKFLYCGKWEPEHYFDPQIRQGISSFSSLSNREEVVVGLKRLRRDIESRHFNNIKCLYDHSGGDYLYIQGYKTKRSV